MTACRIAGTSSSSTLSPLHLWHFLRRLSLVLSRSLAKVRQRDAREDLILRVLILVAKCDAISVFGVQCYGHLVHDLVRLTMSSLTASFRFDGVHS